MTWQSLFLDFLEVTIGMSDYPIVDWSEQIVNKLHMLGDNVTSRPDLKIIREYL